MKYRIRRIHGDGETIGAFAVIDGDVLALLFGDYFREIPRFREWKRPESLESASAKDLEPEIQAAHRSLDIGPEEETGDLTLPTPPANCSEETRKRIAASMAIKIWLRKDA